MTDAPRRQPFRQGNKRPNAGHGGRGGKKRKSKREKGITEGSSEEVLRYDIEALVASQRAAAASATQDTQDPAPETEGDVVEEDTQPTTAAALPEEKTEIDIEILELSSTGDGLGIHAGSPPTHIYVVPFSIPGDIVRARVFRHLPEQSHSMADFLSVVKPSELRDETRIRCKYFSQCSGCQFQMLDYAEQLRLKRGVVERAFARFSGLDPAIVPEIGETMGSPLQYEYRTKLTPHFTSSPVPKAREEAFKACPDVGFMMKGRRRVMDIEDCPIGTTAVRNGLASERARMEVEFGKYQRGATILLRETTKRYPKDNTQEGQELPPSEEEMPAGAVRVETDTHVDIKSFLTDHKAMATEYIDSHVFHNPAGSFFQNNNSILPKFTSFVRSQILPPPTGPKIKYFIDAYSGSGLFTITLSSLFEGSTGIDIDPQSIASASRNAEANGIPAEQAIFIAADAATRLFSNVTYPPDETVVVLDPPRKGCDADFLGQLLRFGPRRVVYVSCNVHTQARDVGVLVRGDGGNGKTRYEIESIRGFDFFPQTAHVEGVAVLNRVDMTAEAKAVEGDEATTAS